ncbi:MAG: type VI secretion system membrane subunit TssM, partial [Gammaproteobacteria bacterium]|nr:type VI secretion system membrane subunit TssM [Gammaproteobacteria bacterium]
NDRERIEHAQTIKERIKELREKLGIDFPIYFFFTKCDLIAGFNDFFDGFSKKEREQAWGFTFPLDSGDERNAYSRFSNEYEQLLQRLNSRVLSRMQAEKDVSKRARILAFPQELAALKPIANDFIKNVFQASRLDKAVMLRGIYMTSGTQQGTPIDRVLGSLASTFGLDQQQVPSLSGQGRSYFIHDVLSNVIFREAGLGDTKKSYQVQLSMMNKAAYAASLLVVVVAAIGWTSSFSDSEQRVADVQQYVEKYIRETRGVDTTKAMPADILPAVNALSSALELLEEDRERWFAQGGLDQSGKLGESLESAYGRVLKTLYQPSLILFLEQQLVNEANNSEQLFAALKTYLMLTDTSKLDRKTVESWLASIWPLYLAGDPTNQARLNLHTTNLLSGDYQAMLPKPSYISHARERLNSVPLAERVYARLRDNSDASKYDLKTKDWLKTASGKSFQFREGIENIPRIPGFFSHNGFHKVFLKENTLVSQSTAEEGWVLGMTETAELNEQELKDLRNNVQKLYLHDYEEVWRNLLNSLDVVKFDSIDHAVDVLDEFSSPTSPLKTLLTAVETNVSLTRLPRVETKVAALGKAADALQAVADSASKRNPDAPWRVVDENFKPIAKLADGGAAGTPPIDQTLKMIADVKATLIKVNGSPNLNEASHKLAAERVKNRGNDAIGRLRKHAQSLPAPVKGWVTALSSESWRVLLVQSKEQIRDNWVNEVYPEYERNIVRRYPLSEKSTTDVSLDDFARFFGPGGTMDTFFKNNLEPFVATRSRVWRENAIEEQDLSLNRQLIVNLQRAASIRDTFFRDNPDTPSLEFIMKPRNLDAKISRFTLELDGNQLVYRHGPTRSSKITWPGNSTNGRAKANFETTTGREYRVDKDGTWALFRLFDEARVKGGGQYDLVNATFQAKSYNAEYEVRTKGVSNPLATNVLHKFSLPKEI